MALFNFDSKDKPLASPARFAGRLLANIAVALALVAAALGVDRAVTAPLLVLLGFIFAPIVGARPNVLVIMVDDLGYADLGVHGGREVRTPNIDALAAGGVRCTSGYVTAPYCSPSRAGLLTGRYQTRFGHEFNPHVGDEAVLGLPLDERTIADRLKSAGYATAVIGKWHQGFTKDRHPQSRGFDEFFGTLANTPFFQPRSFVDSRVSDDVRAVTDPAFYTTDAYTDRAIDWLERNRGRPWFLYLPYNAQHAPLEAPARYLARFPGITDPQRKLFAAMMAAMDDGVGRVLAKVRALGQEENTIIFFIADNGGPTQELTSSNAPLSGGKGSVLEGGLRVPFLISGPGIAGDVCSRVPVTACDILPTIAELCGARVPADIDGLSLVPELLGEAAAGRKQWRAESRHLRARRSVFWWLRMPWVPASTVAS